MHWTSSLPARSCNHAKSPFHKIKPRKCFKKCVSWCIWFNWYVFLSLFNNSKISWIIKPAWMFTKAGSLKKEPYCEETMEFKTYDRIKYCGSPVDLLHTDIWVMRKTIKQSKMVNLLSLMFLKSWNVTFRIPHLGTGDVTKFFYLYLLVSKNWVTSTWAIKGTILVETITRCGIADELLLGEIAIHCNL